MTSGPRYKFRFDRGRGQWLIIDRTTFKRVGAFDHLYECEHWVAGLSDEDALIDLDELVAEDVTR